MKWQPVKDKEKYGVAVQNFVFENDYAIQLTVGDTVHVLEENGDWYFGYVQPNKSVCGIFPKKFVQLKECIVDRTGQCEVVTPRIPPVIQELTAALRDWGLLIRNLYVMRNSKFNEMFDTMIRLIADRKKMLSGQLPGDEMKRVKHIITDNIDLINRLLGLDLVVRDENGNILNPDITSAVKLFKHHKIAAEKLSSNTNLRNSLSPLNDSKMHHSSWSILLHIKNIILLKVQDTCEISLTFYMWDASDNRESKDVKESREKPLTEPYLFTWTPGGYTENPDLYIDLKCLFTDLSHKLFLPTDSQIFMLGTVIREGLMTNKEKNEDRRSSFSPKKAASGTDSIKRPYGVFAADVTEDIENQFIKATTNNIINAPSAEIFIPFYQCGEKESIDAVLRKFFTSRNDLIRDRGTNLGVWVELSLLNGNLRQLQNDHPHYSTLHELPISNRLSLGDNIVPGEVRNDIYVTLLGGEFSRERNVEVTLKVCNEHGMMIPGVISVGSGKDHSDIYRSVTYHHDGKPRWMETIKIALPIEEFRKAHLKFTFKHRSTNEVKDKTEKPFALSYVNLIQPNGTTLLNVDHELIVYKIDSKKWNEDDASYVRLPCMRVLNMEDGGKKKEEAFTQSNKDSFFISTVFCSTKLTQKAELLSLLEWGGSGSSSKTDLRKHLLELRNVPAEELLIFLQDTLDVLFEILINSSKDNESDNMVFEALINVIHIAVEQNKHEHFKSVLDTYIEQNFHATLAYSKLILILKSYIEEACVTNTVTNTETLNKAMKCLYHIIKIITRSRRLFFDLNARGQEPFQESVECLLLSIGTMMKCTKDVLLSVQGLCLKYISTTIPDIMAEFSHIRLSELLIEILSQLKGPRLSLLKLTTMCEIIQGPLFVDPACRAILLRAFIAIIKILLAGNEEVTDNEVALRKKSKLTQLFGVENAAEIGPDSKKTEELELCVKILNVILDILFGSEVGPTVEDLMLMTEELLPDVLAIVSKMRRDDPILHEFVAVLISLYRQMPISKSLEIFNCMERPVLMHILVDILMVLRGLIEDPVFQPDWCEMIMLQNSVSLKTLQLISRVLMQHMMDPFMDIIWGNYFQCAIKFITQSSLQLEKFSPGKRQKILNRYRDMRREAAQMVKGLWRDLGQYRINFIVRSPNTYSLVGPFLEMAMLPEVEVRRSTIPIFFDMMSCEYNSVKKMQRGNRAQFVRRASIRRESRIKENFDEFENQMLEHLDQLVEDGLGDEHFRDVFDHQMRTLCKEVPEMEQQGLQFVKTICSLMEVLLQYRTIMATQDHSPEIRMSCTVSLLDFYASIDCRELFLRYVYKLYDLHCQCDNYTEAGYTLQLHASRLKWSHKPIPEPLRCSRFPDFLHHDTLKEKLYYEIISNFEKGKMWEAAINTCKDLLQRYEEVTMEYQKLSLLYTQMAGFYRDIMDPKNIRPKPAYFRVAYYGRGFPAFLQNKVFIYRGNGFERISEFQTRILEQFHNAELMKKLSAPSEELKDSPHQYIQINTVECQAPQTTFTQPSVAERIREYHQVNHVDTFTYLRPFHKGQRDKENEFATLWTEKTTLKTMYKLPGLLRCFRVQKESVTQLSPLDNAIDTMKTSNDHIDSAIKSHSRDSMCSLEPLTMKLSGMVDAAVMGGISNYQKAFLTPEYKDNNPEDVHKIEKLVEHIKKQIPLLELALEVHGLRASEAIQGLHLHLIDSFKKMKETIQEAYGVAPKPSDLEHEVQVMKMNIKRNSGTARNSNYSLSSADNVPSMTPIIPRTSLVNIKGTMTVPRNVTLSPTGQVFRKDKKDKVGLKYLLRRESFSSNRESSTQWFAPTEPETPPSPNSSTSTLHKQTTQDLRRQLCKLGISRDSGSRPNSLALSSNSPTEPQSSDRFTFDSNVLSNGGHSPRGSSPPSPPLPDSPSPPPLPMKTRDIDFDRVNESLSTLDEDDEAPQKPPRPPHVNVNGESRC